MSLMGRKRVSALDILQNDYEYCIISYYEEGTRNELGEPTRVLVQRATNVKCAINSMVRTTKYASLTSSYELTEQGIVEETTHHIIVTADQIINAGDVVTDYDGVNYDVLLSVDWQTHKEAFLRKIN
jgi:hypothetical protein